MIRVFIGFDKRETVAYHVLSQSILSKASRPIFISPIILEHLKDTFTRPRDPLQSTDFSFSRFLVPYLCNYEGWSLFLDSDMLACEDIANLWALRDENCSVMVVKHDYQPQHEKKFLGETQSKYQKKNWSSMMLFNNARCQTLTPEYVNTATGLELHQFKWLESDEQIGEVDKKWNYLVGVYPKCEPQGIIHYTDGGPYFNDYKDVDYADLWFQEQKSMLYAKN